MDFHLDNTKEGRAAGNSRNGYDKKTLKSNFGLLELSTPKDWYSTFEPQIIPKRSTKSAMLEKAILSLYAKGMTTRDIQATLQDLYHVDISPSLISKVTDVVKDVFVFCVDGLTGFPDAIKGGVPQIGYPLGTQLGEHNNNLHIPSGDKTSDIYDQRDRVAQRSN